MRRKLKSDTDYKRKRRHMHIRNRLVGTAERPRVCVFRSINHIYAQIIDDSAGNTLVAASSQEQAGKGGAAESAKIGVAAAVGKLVAERAKAQGITQVVFDRGGYKFHGRVKALADASREAGLVF